MIPHSHFTRIADKQDVDAKTVERDYVLTHVLAAAKLPTEKMMGWVKGAGAAGVKALRPYRGGPPGRP